MPQAYEDLYKEFLMEIREYFKYLPTLMWNWGLQTAPTTNLHIFFSQCDTLGNKQPILWISMVFQGLVGLLWFQSRGFIIHGLQWGTFFFCDGRWWDVDMVDFIGCSISSNWICWTFDLIVIFGEILFKLFATWPLSILDELVDSVVSLLHLRKRNENHCVHRLSQICPVFFSEKDQKTLRFDSETTPSNTHVGVVFFLMEFCYQNQ